MAFHTIEVKRNGSSTLAAWLPELEKALSLRNGTDHRNGKHAYLPDVLPYFPNPLGMGIYAILNTSNGKIYIGSARHLLSRWRIHKMELICGKHGNDYLQKAFNKSPESFVFQVVEFVKDGTLLISREQFWMDFYRAAERTFGYNICTLARSSLGVKQRPEVVLAHQEALKKWRLSPAGLAERAKSSERATNRTPSERQRAKASVIMRECHRSNPTFIAALSKATHERLKKCRKQVLQCDASGNPIKLWSSLTEATTAMGKSPRNSKCIKRAIKRGNTAFGTYWRLVNP